MTYLKFLTLAFCFLLFNACVEEEIIEGNQSVRVADIDGNDFFLNGTLNGAAFRIEHFSSNAINVPNNEHYNPEVNGFLQSHFSSKFDNQAVGEMERTVVKMAITESGFNKLEEVITLNEFPWYSRDNSPVWQNGELIWNPSIAEIFFPQTTINGIWYSYDHENEFNKFVITNVTLLDQAETDRDVYKVEGNFKIKLFDDDEQEADLVIDSFSAIFLEN